MNIKDFSYFNSILLYFSILCIKLVIYLKFYSKNKELNYNYKYVANKQDKL